MATRHEQESSAGFRLSPQQERLFSAGSAGPGYRSQCVVELRGPVDEGRLRAAVEAAVGRHEILRTAFARPSGVRMPSQVINDWLPPLWETRSGAGEILSPETLGELAAGEAKKPLDLERGPLLRMLLLGLEAERAVLVLTLPVVCIDQMSQLALLEEIAHLYGAGVDADMPEPLQYADYAEWRHELLAGDTPEAVAGTTFWKTRGDAPWEALPHLLFGSAAEPDDARIPRRLPIALDPTVVASIPEAAAAARATAGLFLEAAWHALVARLAGVDAVVVGGLLHGRHHAELEGAVGLFAQDVPIRSLVHGGTTFAEVLEQVRQSRAAAERRQDYRPVPNSSPDLGFELVEHSGMPRLGQAEVVLQLLRARLGPHTLTLTCRLGGGTTTAELEYDPAAYPSDTVEQIGTSFAVLLGEAVRDPNAAVSRLHVLEASERDRLVLSVNATETDLPPPPVHRLFAEQARRAPDVTAVAVGGRSVTYGDLDKAANRLAHRLRELGVGPDAVVGLCLDRSCDMVAALLGILKAGGAYLPLNLEHPAARLAVQLEQAAARVLVTQEELLGGFDGFDGEIVCIDRDAEALEALRGDEPEAVAGPDDLAYVMFTSGSTGTPKGVAVTHGNLANYVADMVRRLEADGEPLTFAAVSAISTDLGNTSVFPSLASGGTLLLASPEASIDGALFASEVEQQPIDVLKITPSHLRALLAGAADRNILPRRWLVLGGESAPWGLVEDVLGRGQCRVLNHYGPTETTVGSCTFEVRSRADAPDAASVPIGRPISNTRAYVLDEALQPIPEGMPGELFLAGAGVARGYIGQLELTEERFLPDPFVGEGGRMYSTGDRVRRLRDGSIEFLGRADDQVKIRGFRVEPAEVESVLLGHPAIREAAVVAVGDEELRLVGYVATSGEPPPWDELRAHLRSVLPEHMVPAELAELDVLPRTASGKVDRRLLAESDVFRATREAAYVAPRTPLEEELAHIWEDLFGVAPIGVESDFFELGGHSLLAARLMARVQTTFGVELYLRAVFEQPTIAGFAETLAGSMLSGQDGAIDAMLSEIEAATDRPAGA